MVNTRAALSGAVCFLLMGDFLRLEVLTAVYVEYLLLFFFVWVLLDFEYPSGLAEAQKQPFYGRNTSLARVR